MFNSQLISGILVNSRGAPLLNRVRKAEKGKMLMDSTDANVVQMVRAGSLYGFMPVFICSSISRKDIVSFLGVQLIESVKSKGHNIPKIQTSFFAPLHSASLARVFTFCI